MSDTQTQPTRGLIPQKEALKFMTGGNSTVTFKSLISGSHFTYKIVASDDQKFLFIKVLNGPDNTSNYKDILIFQLKDDGTPCLMNRSGVKPSSSIVAFRFVFMNLLLKPGIPMTNLEIWHEGKCCRCGRKLTAPESIANGIGPECITKQNSFNI